MSCIMFHTYVSCMKMHENNPRNEGEKVLKQHQKIIYIFIYIIQMFLHVANLQHEGSS